MLSQEYSPNLKAVVAMPRKIERKGKEETRFRDFMRRRIAMPRSPSRITARTVSLGRLFRPDRARCVVRA
jgi:hypothetical protein